MKRVQGKKSRGRRALKGPPPCAKLFCIHHQRPVQQVAETCGIAEAASRPLEEGWKTSLVKAHAFSLFKEQRDRNTLLQSILQKYRLFDSISNRRPVLQKQHSTAVVAAIIPHLSSQSLGAFAQANFSFVSWGRCSLVKSCIEWKPNCKGTETEKGGISLKCDKFPLVTLLHHIRTPDVWRSTNL